jgi:uncharacterized protein (DUF39 family)
MAGAGTLMVMGDMKGMDPKWVAGVSMLGYGCSINIGLGVPIPILNEDMARYTGVSDEDIYTRVVDYSSDYPNGESKALALVNYAQLKNGMIKFNGKEIPAVPLSSHVRALEVAEILKSWIIKGEFLLTEPQVMIPSAKKR